MEIKIYLNGKKISKKAAIEMYGKERIEKRISEAIEGHLEDPLELQSWMDGMEIKVSD